MKILKTVSIIFVTALFVGGGSSVWWYWGYPRWFKETTDLTCLSLSQIVSGMEKNGQTPLFYGDSEKTEDESGWMVFRNPSSDYWTLFRVSPTVDGKMTFCILDSGTISKI